MRTESFHVHHPQIDIKGYFSHPSLASSMQVEKPLESGHSMDECVSVFRRDLSIMETGLVKHSERQCSADGIGESWWSVVLLLDWTTEAEDTYQLHFY